MILDELRYRLLYSSLRQLAALPHSIRYQWLARLVSIVLRSAGYRREVVRGNLSKSFPAKTIGEIRDIERLFYRDLAETIIDIISMSGISEEQILAQMSYSNYREVEQQTRGRTWISAMSHYAMWEYVANYALLTDHRVVAVYHRLSSPMFERLMQQIRSRFGTQPVASGDIVRKIAEECGVGASPMVIGMVADQVPPNYKLTQWYRFLGRDTKFFSGMGKCAVKYHLPVYFLDVDKVRPGYYVGTFEQIYSGDESISAGEITERYVRRLENMILRRPELWLWSHRRWKYDRTQIG